MSSLSSTGSVIASGYLSAVDYGALSPSRQTASSAAQSQINDTISLVNSVYGGAWAPNLFTSPAPTSNAAAAVGLSTQESSELALVSSVGGAGGFTNGLVSQSALLQSLVRNGLEGVFGGTSPSAAAASGQAAQLSSQQAMIANLYAQANATDSLAGTRLNQSA